MLAQLGRRVVVRSEGEEVVCHLKGLRAVVGDEVRFEHLRGGGGRLAEVLPRERWLARSEGKHERVLVANLTHLMIVAAVQEPPFRPGLVDRYLVAADTAGLEPVLVLNKIDLGVPAEVDIALAEWEQVLDLQSVRVSAHDAEGLDAVRELLGPGVTAVFVGHSGVGKTSILQALLPEVDVGAIGELSEAERGAHTTTRSTLFALPSGGELVDSPGIRSFAPARVTPETLRLHFPGMHTLRCKFRDCQHRAGEEGCVAEESLPPRLLESYRRLHESVVEETERFKP